MGDSQLQRLDSAVLGNSTYNFASSGESYFITYYKLLKLIDGHPNAIENILLGVSWHSFAPVYNRLTDVDFFDGNSSLQRYFYLIPLKASWEFSKNEPIRLLKSIDKTTDWGGYYKSSHKNPDTSIVNEMLRSHYEIRESEDATCLSQEDYLKKIDSLCQSKNIQLILVTCPYHHGYSSRVDSTYVNHFNNVLGSLKTRKTISFINESVSSNWMSDGCHLNQDGSVYYTTLIVREMKGFDSYNRMSKSQP